VTVVGLVLVSHSAKLAEGAAELAAQVPGDVLRIAVAGGLDVPDSASGADAALGTDAVLVLRAIEEVWSEDGVLVLMDLGSAVLSAEMALDLLPEERRARVRLATAPFVEGAVAAAVAASLGDPLERVAEEAGAALGAKVAQLVPRRTDGRVLPTTATPPPGAARAGAQRVGAQRVGAQRAGAQPQTERRPPVLAAEPAEALSLAGPTLRVTVGTRLGLHARPAALLVRTAAGFDADVTVADLTAGRGPVSARSLNAVATLGARFGDELLLRATGPQAEEALAALGRLAAEGFGESSEARPTGLPDPEAGLRAAVAADEVAPAPPGPGTVLHGLPVSPGVAVAAAHGLRPAPVELPGGCPDDPGAEWSALRRALDAARHEIGRARAAAAARAGDYDAAIFDAHLLFLEDEALLTPSRAGVMEEGKSAARSWGDAVAAAAAAWETLDDPHLRARAGDLRSVGDQVLRLLLGLPAPPAPGGSGIVVASDLSPADVVNMDTEAVLGIACALGGPASHAAILARALGIPAVVGAGRELLAVRDGTLLALDGDAGTVTVEPPAEAVRAAERRRCKRAQEETAARARAHLPAVTLDGVPIHVAANVTGLADVGAAVVAGADGVGLLRTEFLFFEADHLPTEDEQELAYRAAAEALEGRPLVLRTLDVGADKPLPYLPREEERNPFLGLRGVRLSLRHPDLLAAQLRAATRVAADHDVRVMFPMVATVDELRQAREALDDARDALVAEGVAVPERVPAGIMVEVPAAALLAEAFVPHVDFFSLGTNDLTQYTLAAERANAEVAALADALHPAVLRLVERTVSAAAKGGIGVAVCGEVAGDPIAIPLLLGLGVTELSMSPPRIALAKEAVRTTATARARSLAREALTAASAAEVRRRCGG
jgi:phosphocarrier protein FPr